MAIKSVIKNLTQSEQADLISYLETGGYSQTVEFWPWFYVNDEDTDRGNSVQITDARCLRHASVWLEAKEVEHTESDDYGNEELDRSGDWWDRQDLGVE